MRFYTLTENNLTICVYVRNNSMDTESWTMYKTRHLPSSYTWDNFSPHKRRKDLIEVDFNTFCDTCCRETLLENPNQGLIGGGNASSVVLSTEA